MVIIAIAGIAAAIGPVLVVLGTLGIALGGIVTGAGVVIGAISSITLPMIVAAAAILALVAAIAIIVGSFIACVLSSEDLRNKIYELGQTLKSIAENYIRLLIDEWNLLKPTLEQVAGIIMSVAMPAFNGLVDCVSDIAATFNLYWPQIRDAALGALKGVLDALQPLIDKAQELAPIVGEFLSNAFKTLGDIVNQYIIPYLPTVISLFGDGLAAAINFVVPVITTLVDEFMKFATAVWPSVEAVLNNLKGLIEQLWPTLQKIAEKAIEVGGAFLDFLGPAITTAIQLIGPVVTTVFKFMWDSLNNLITLIRVVVVPGFQFLVDVSIGIFNGLWTLIKPILDLLAWQFNNTVELIKAAWAGLQWLWDFVSGVVNGIIGVFQGLYNTLVGASIIPDLINGIIGCFQTGFDTVKGIIQGAIDTIIGIFNTFKDTAVNLITGAWNTMKSVCETAWNGIKDFINGVINGIVSTIQGISSKIGDPFAGFVNTAKSTLNSLIDAANTVMSRVKSILGEVDKLIGDKISAANSAVSTAKSILNSVVTTVTGGGSSNTPSTPSSATTTTTTTMNYRGRALGGWVGAGIPYWVGERGPELFVPRNNGTIIPNNAFKSNQNQMVTIIMELDGQQIGKVVSPVVSKEIRLRQGIRW
jgi:phage-related protein